MLKKMLCIITLAVYTSIMCLSAVNITPIHAAETPVKNYTQYPGVPIYYDENVTENEAQAVAEAYLMLPDNIKEMLCNNCINFYVEDYRDVNRTRTTKSGTRVAFVTNAVYAKKSTGEIRKVSNAFVTVGVHNPKVTPQNLTFGVLHEIGHVIDAVYAGGYPVTQSMLNVTPAADWKNIYPSELDALFTLLPSQGVSNASQEVFAHAFALYILKNEELHQSCPGTYAYVENVVNSF